MVKRKKRSNGEGALYKDKRTGKWKAQIITGRDPKTGKYKRKTFTGKNKTDAIKKLEKFKAEVINESYVEPKNIILRDWLYKYINIYKVGVAKKTYDWYENFIEAYFNEGTIGDIKIQKLKNDKIQEFINNLNEKGKINGEGGLSYRTIEAIYKFLKGSLYQAVESDYLRKNPAKKINLPKNKNNKKKFYTLEEETKIIEAIKDENRLDYFVKLALGTGLRQGELRALTWENIDFDEAEINVTNAISREKNRDPNSARVYDKVLRDPKTSSSKRVVPLPDSIVKLLKEYKKKYYQEPEKEPEEDSFNPEYDLVFPSVSGKILDPSVIRKHWKKIVNKAGVRYLTFHNTRHAYATRLHEKGVSNSEIQELLGHSEVKITLDTYVHVDNSRKKEAVSKIDDIFSN
jgi:integrase